MRTDLNRISPEYHAEALNVLAMIRTRPDVSRSECDRACERLLAAYRRAAERHAPAESSATDPDHDIFADDLTVSGLTGDPGFWA